MGRSRSLGYDMRAENPDPDEENLLLSASFMMQEAARSTENEGKPGAEWLAIQEAYEDKFRDLDRIHASVFYLSIWDMRQARRIMKSLGMLDLDVTSPRNISAEEYGVTEDMLAVDYPAFPDALTPVELKTLQKARRELLEGCPEEPRGISPYKLGSNDGWLIQPQEIIAALKTGDERYQNTEETLEYATFFTSAEFWPEWISFLRYCALHGGMRLG